ncbi:hypothetical protein Emed_001435 [Eimeria media]
MQTICLVPDSGALAAFARVKYPALISGSISSSSPVLAQEKFVSFDLKVQQGLPDSCRAAAAAAITALNRNVTLGHMEEELRRFDCTGIPSATDADKVAFVYSVVDTLSEAVQYERPVVRPLVELLCNFLDVPPTSSREATEKVNEAAKTAAAAAAAAADVAAGNDEAAASAATGGEAEVGIGSQQQVEETLQRGAGAAERATGDREEALLNGLASYFKASLKRKNASCRDHEALDVAELRAIRLLAVQMEGALLIRALEKRIFGDVSPELGGSHCTDFYGPTAQDSKSLQLGRNAIAAAVEGFIARHRESFSEAQATKTLQSQEGASTGIELLKQQEHGSKTPSTSEL